MIPINTLTAFVSNSVEGIQNVIWTFPTTHTVQGSIHNVIVSLFISKYTASHVLTAFSCPSHISRAAISRTKHKSKYVFPVSFDSLLCLHKTLHCSPDGSLSKLAR